MLHVTIMAGGGGTRFWPRSRQARPKQFLSVTGDHSLLQQAFDRVEGLAGDRVWVVTGEVYRAETARQLTKLAADRIVGEPCGRDTAPCIGLAASLILREDPAAVMIVTPADHVIQPEREFVRAAQVAARTAEEHPSALITFGISPTYPATGYGYIHRGEEIARSQDISVRRVLAFVEKPPLEIAEQYFASGEYFWNAGIFVWKAATLLENLRTRKPAMYSALQRVADAWHTPRRQEVLEKEYPQMEKISIDKAVMEQALDVLVVQAPYRWDDVGSWLALERMHPQDADGNTIQATHAGIHTRDCVVVAEPGKLVATIGVHNLLIVQDGDAILIADKREEGTVKDLVALLRKKGLEKYL